MQGGPQRAGVAESRCSPHKMNSPRSAGLNELSSRTGRVVATRYQNGRFTQSRSARG
jgi:hypothetical protein